MPDRPSKPELVEQPPDELVRDSEPPVVARLVVEIRSDGTRTIARGAVEDVHRGERTAIEARGDSPLQLAIALARTLAQLPRLAARSAFRAALRGPKDSMTRGRGLLGRRKDK